MWIFTRTSIITSTNLYLYRFYFDIPLKSIALFTCFTLDSIQSLSFGWQSNNRTLTDWQWLDTLWQPRAGEVKEKKYLCTLCENVLLSPLRVIWSCVSVPRIMGRPDHNHLSLLLFLNHHRWSWNKSSQVYQTISLMMKLWLHYHPRWSWNHRADAVRYINGWSIYSLPELLWSEVRIYKRKQESKKKKKKDNMLSIFFLV